MILFISYVVFLPVNKMKNIKLWFYRKNFENVCKKRRKAILKMTLKICFANPCFFGFPGGFIDIAFSKHLISEQIILFYVQKRKRTGKFKEKK